MKNLIALLTCFLFVTAVGYADESRSVFNTNGTGQQLSVKIGDRSLTVNSGYSNHFTDSVLFPVVLRKSNDQKMYFETMTLFMRHFLKGYKIGKVDKQYILVWLGSDEARYPMFKISVNDLKLVNGRDFGKNDMLAFENGIVYPIKEILKNGVFVDVMNQEQNTEFKEQYKKYLKTYEFPGVIEAAVEGWYEKKKTK